MAPIVQPWLVVAYKKSGRRSSLHISKRREYAVSSPVLKEVEGKMRTRERTGEVPGEEAWIESEPKRSIV